MAPRRPCHRVCRAFTSWADAVRREHVGDAVHLRGLIEISSHCVRQCMYCGLRQANRDLPRYRMTSEEILECARQAETLGYGTVVMQAGEDDALTADWIADIVRWIKRETRLAVTLSLGERHEDEFNQWRAGGRRPISASIRNVRPGAVQCDSPGIVGQAHPSRLTLAQATQGPGIRGRRRRDGWHSWPVVRKPRARRPHVSRAGSRHDRHWTIHSARRNALGHRSAAS